MKKKSIILFLIFTLVLINVISYTGIYAEDNEGSIEEVASEVKDAIQEQETSTKATNETTTSTDEMTTATATTTEEAQATATVTSTSMPTSSSTADKDNTESKDKDKTIETNNENNAKENNDEEDQFNGLDEDAVLNIITAYAKNYDLNEEEAAYHVALLLGFIEGSKEDGGKVNISPNGSLVFDFPSEIKFELKKDGQFLINDVDISEKIAGFYDLSEEEANVFMFTLFDKSNKTVNNIKYSDGRIVVILKKNVEITKDGVVYLDGNKVEKNELENISKESGKEKVNPLTVVAQNKGVLPKTGESASNATIYFGLGIIIIGALYAVHKIKKVKA